MSKCDIIVPVWDELNFTKNCINELKAHTKYPYRLIIIDNGSQDPTKVYLESLKESSAECLLIRNNTNLGFVKAINQGFKISTLPYVCLLNNDTRVTKNWLTNLINTIETAPRNVGIANPTSNVFGQNQAENRDNSWQEMHSCKGFCMLIKKEVIAKIGFFDEIYSPGYFEEKDFCQKAINAGYMCILAKGAFVFHKDKVSFDKIKERDKIFKRNEEIYNKKWGRPLNLALAIKGEHELEQNKEILYKILNKGHHLYVFFQMKKTPTLLKGHINIRYRKIPKFFFGYIVLFKLWERHKKKRIEVMIAEDKNILHFFKKFKFLHKAKIFDWKEKACLMFLCP